MEELVKLRGGMRGANAGSGENYRPLGVFDTVENFTAAGPEFVRIVGDLLSAGRGRRILLRIVGAKRGWIDGNGLYIHWNVEPARSGASTLSQMPGAFKVISDRERVIDQHRVFRDLLNHRDDVGFLVSELAQAGDALGAHAGFTFNLARDDQHRDGIGPRAKHSVQSVDAAGPGGDVDYAGLSADTRIGFGRHGGSLFVMIADILNARFPAYGVVEVHGAAAGNEKDVAHAPIRQLAHDVVGELHARVLSDWGRGSREITGFVSPRRRMSALISSAWSKVARMMGSVEPAIVWGATIGAPASVLPRRTGLLSIMPQISAAARAGRARSFIANCPAPQRKMRLLFASRSASWDAKCPLILSI